MKTRRLVMVSLVLGLLTRGNASAGTLFFDDAGTFNALVSVSGFTLQGIEDWESSTLAPNSIASFLDPLAPGVPNGPFPTGTNSATGLTVQSNTLGGAPSVPQTGGGLATASAPFLGTPTDQVSTNTPGQSFDMIFALPGTRAVSFNPLVFDAVNSGNGGMATIRVYDSTNLLIGTIGIPVEGFTSASTFMGVLATSGQEIGRINVFATSPNGQFSGADNIAVYTSAQAAVPEPATLTLLLALGLPVLGFRHKKS